MEAVLRITIVYVVVMAGFRVMGKRELSQLSPAELVTLLLIPEIFSHAMVDEDFSMINALISFTTLLSLVFVTSMAAQLSKRFSSVIDASPSVLVANGQLLEANMNRERITPEELYSELHMSGLEELSQVKWAILEPDGQISVIRTDGRPPDRPPAKDPAL